MGEALTLARAAAGRHEVPVGAIVVRDNPLLEPFEPLRIAGLDWWEGTGRPGGLYRPVPLLLDYIAGQAAGSGKPAKPARAASSAARRKGAPKPATKPA